MSRIGAKSIPLPAGVNVSAKPDAVVVKGPKGELTQKLTGGVAVTVDAQTKTVQVRRRGETRQDRALHGLYRALVRNMVQGVSQGFQDNLEIEGVGYNAKVEGKDKLVLNIGFCLPVTLTIPAGLTVETPKPTQVAIKGCDRQVVGQFAALIRKVRPPEPYKGKGIRYAGEVIQRKAGKAVGSKG
ncbi:MAG TPA: 50S ribosomal protein L6 [Planctomycetota bacterium]|nr:50S ribosomal protein L6 [Planctomycetota bacterium]